MISSIATPDNIEIADSKQTLLLIQKIIRSLHLGNIIYCHWKSNEHLASSMTGIADLDILFDHTQEDIVKDILQDHGFKIFIPPVEKKYRDIEDFIGLDIPSGKVVHVHAHFKLTLGESYLKGYQFNWEHIILENRIFDGEFGIYRIAPSFELLLLYFRLALKLRNRDKIKFYVKGTTVLRSSIIKEYYWLKERCTNSELKTSLRTLLNGSDNNDESIHRLVIQELSQEVLLKLSRLLTNLFRHQRLYAPMQARLLRWYREIMIRAYRRWARMTKYPTVSQRVHSQCGLIVAIIGADGSGKSTAIANLRHTFQKKIDVYNLYMGKGKSGNSSWIRKILSQFKKKYSGFNVTKKCTPNKWFTFSHKNNTPEKQITFIKNNPVNRAVAIQKNSFRYTLFKCIEALAVAHERKNKLRLMRQAKLKGMLVICDRFPQNQLTGYNDGPLINYLLYSSNYLFRWFAKAEAKIYKQAEKNHPDILFKLIANAEVIAERKPSMASIETLRLKNDGIKRLHFSDDCYIATIDANQPLEMVLTKIKECVWQKWS